MNKTVNINLAGLFFYIDEDAYAKLQRYLAAIKRSFTGAQGQDEIIADIEARIAELFSEKISHERQVIGLEELDQVIAIMGQPEDYAVDEEIFEDEPIHKQKAYRESKKLFRDTDNSYIGGVSSGLGHYLGIDPLWIRLGMILIVLLGFGFPILLYFLLWILVPEAKTTSEKLAMTGKPVNIDNIQQKVKEGFGNVADSVKNVDYEKAGRKARDGARSVFTRLGEVFLFLLKIIGKIIGVFLILVGGATVIGLFVGLFTAGTLDAFDGALMEQFHMMNTTGTPFWLVSLLLFLAIGIPFFFLFYLGLKIVVGNLKSMPLAGKLTFLGLWLIAVITLGVLGIRQAAYTGFEGEVSSTTELNLRPSDTLRLEMAGNQTINDGAYRSSNIKIFSVDGQRKLYGRDVRLIVRTSKDSISRIQINKRAQGGNWDEGKALAQDIEYNYKLDGNTLLLDGFYLTDVDNRYREQEVTVILTLPEGMTLYADENTYSYHRNSSRYRDLLDNGQEEEYLIMRDGDLVCPSCDEDIEDEDEWNYRSYENNDTPDWEEEDEPIDVRRDQSSPVSTDSING
ncbi:PspC domain-containing protein [Croceiramulus getboli]|nr:PspC domain-containing protein [Flavobacteriaceae bacterium YJPT1-3]